MLFNVKIYSKNIELFKFVKYLLKEIQESFNRKKAKSWK